MVLYNRGGNRFCLLAAMVLKMYMAEFSHIRFGCCAVTSASSYGLYSIGHVVGL